MSDRRLSLVLGALCLAVCACTGVAPATGPTTMPPDAPATQTSTPTPTPTSARTPAPEPSAHQATDDPGTAIYYKDCTEVEQAGAAPLRLGDPGYRTGLDPDGDGVACA